MTEPKRKSKIPSPMDESILKFLYLAMSSIGKKWTMPFTDWKWALNQFVILFGDRVSTV